MVKAQEIHHHMEVVGSDGAHVGTVDHMEGAKWIKLTKNDPQAGGEHHLIPLKWVDHIDNQIHLSKASADVMNHWQSA